MRWFVGIVALLCCVVWARAQRRSKFDRMDKVVRLLESIPPAVPQVWQSWSRPHNSSNNAIFAVAYDKGMKPRHASWFAGTARQAGFDGDIVLAVHPEAEKGFLDKLKEYGITVYVIEVACNGTKVTDIGCSLPGIDKKASVNTLRYFFYQNWCMKYSESSYILTSDFYDVFFQSNPFKFHDHEWKGNYQLVMYQEAHPNMAIERNPWNRGWIENCYGAQALRLIGSYTLSSSGNTMGTRNGVGVYAYLITKQLDPRARYSKNSTESNQKCLSVGMDQAFHNWLLYSSALSSYMDVKVYAQGEGAVNVVGGLFGPLKRVHFDLGDYGWKILKGEAPYKYIHNWGGEISPVVHQLDRFNTAEINGGYKLHMAVFQNLGLL